MIYKKNRLNHSKFLAVLFIALLFTSCGQKEQTLEEKKEQLKTYQDQLSELEFNINKLKKEIKDEDSTGTFLTKDFTLVKVAHVKKKPFEHFVEVRGSASSKTNVTISAEMNGVVKNVLKKEGDYVRKGEIIAKIDDEVILRNIDEVKTNLDLAEKVYTRRKNLWDQKIGSEIQYLEAKNNKESLERRLEALQSQLDKTNIRSTINGAIDDIFINEGEYAAPGMPIARIINLSEMRIVADVSERYLENLHTGDTVTLNIPSINLKKKLPVMHVGQFVDEGSRTFKIEIKISNKDGKLKPNMLATIKFPDYKNKNAMVIPTKIIQQSREGDFVFIASSQANKVIAKKVMIKKGRSYLGETEVDSGMKGDEEIIVAGFRDVSDGEEILIKKDSKPITAK